MKVIEGKHAQPKHCSGTLNICTDEEELGNINSKADAYTSDTSFVSINATWKMSDSFAPNMLDAAEPN